MDERTIAFTAPAGMWDRSVGESAVSAWQASGLSQTAWCRQHGIPGHRLSYWKRRLGSKFRSATESTGVILFSPVVANRQESGLDVMIGEGVRITVCPGCDLALLRAVVEALR